MHDYIERVNFAEVSSTEDLYEIALELKKGEL